MAITNKTDISLALAVWLLHDEYDYVKNLGPYISATTLMKPLRHIILPKRLPPELVESDVEDFIARKLGNSLHDSIEKAWTKGYAKSLELMGYPDSLIERVKVNPSHEELEDNTIPVYLEQRLYREIEGVTIGGKFDLITEGVIQDNKSTSAYSWVHGDKDDSYQLQMSIYRWLDAGQEHPKIFEDHGRINFIFTDWQKMQARQNPAYPQKRVEYKEIALLSLQETEAWIIDKIQQIKCWGSEHETDLPECTPDELWQSEPKFKYYADASKTDGKSTKNFDNAMEARAHMASKGGKGIVKTVPGEPKRCGYCEVFPICTQKDKYFS